jgi:uncharacterized protein (TIGR02452 family)
MITTINRDNLGFCTKNEDFEVRDVYDPQGELIDVCASITGNPTHMGHMHMIAQAVNRLKNAGYKVNQLHVSLSDEDYLQGKVQEGNDKIEKDNSSGKAHQMFKVCLPREKRIEFLRSAILQAKNEKIFVEEISIGFDGENRVQGGSQKSKKVFRVCGADFAKGERLFSEDKKFFGNWVIVTREGTELAEFSEYHTKNFSRLIIKNDDDMNTYSSSKIQNGSYDQLPASVKDEFKSLHERAQSQVASLFEDIKSRAQSTLASECKTFESPVARETAEAIVAGKYFNTSGKSFPLRSGAQLLEESSSIPNTLLEGPVRSIHDESNVIVIEQDCLNAAEDELKNNPDSKIAVLMFSSTREPGGAMSEIGGTQEEELCRRSDIFGFMHDQVTFQAKTLLYPLRSQQTDRDYNGIEYNRMIHVPNVTVFRSEKKKGCEFLEQPFEVGMLVSAPLVKPGYERTNGITRYKREEDAEQLRKLIMTQLNVAYKQGYDTLILGAFGCGAFQNPPELIAACYKEIIHDYFQGAFKKIVFAILDGGGEDHNPEGNLKPFNSIFKSPTSESVKIAENGVIQPFSGPSMSKSIIGGVSLLAFLGLGISLMKHGPQIVSPSPLISSSFKKIGLAAAGALAAGTAAYYYKRRNPKIKANDRGTDHEPDT